MAGNARREDEAELLREMAARTIQNGKTKLALASLETPLGAKSINEDLTKALITDGKADIQNGMNTMAIAGGTGSSKVAEKLDAKLSRIMIGKYVALLEQQRLELQENPTRENDEWVNEVYRRLKKPSLVWKSDMRGNLGTEQWVLLNKIGAKIILMLSDSRTMRSRPRLYLVSRINRTAETPNSFSIQVIFKRLEEEDLGMFETLKRNMADTFGIVYRQRNNFILSVPKGL